MRSEKRVTTLEEAIEVLNRERHRDLDSWKVFSRSEVDCEVSSPENNYWWFSPDEAIAIANHLVANQLLRDAEGEAQRSSSRTMGARRSQLTPEAYEMLQGMAAEAERRDAGSTDDDARVVLTRLVASMPDEWSVEVHAFGGSSTVGVASLRSLLAAAESRNAPAALTWTSEPPKVAGWYWMRTSDQIVAMVEIKAIDFEKGTVGAWTWPYDSFAGPIAPPVEAEKP